MKNKQSTSNHKFIITKQKRRLNTRNQSCLSKQLVQSETVLAENDNRRSRMQSSLSMLDYTITNERSPSIQLPKMFKNEFNEMKLIEAYRKIDEYKLKEKIKNKNRSQQPIERVHGEISRPTQIEHKKHKVVQEVDSKVKYSSTLLSAMMQYRMTMQ